MNLNGLYLKGKYRRDGHGFSHELIPASPADILPRLGYSQCGDCGGKGKRLSVSLPGYPDCPSCRRGWILGDVDNTHDCDRRLHCRPCNDRGWIPGDELVEVMANGIAEADDYAPGFSGEHWRMVRAAALALVDHLLEGDPHV
jgi:hypothetical protein